MAQELGDSLVRGGLGVVIIAGMLLMALCSCSPSGHEAAPDENFDHFDETNPIGANAACYVCHMTYVKEELSKTHLKAKITCVHCHGTSAGHANDEDIGATRPDVTFEPDKVDEMCLDCHKKHDLADAEADLICTDCHGTHRIRTASPEKE